uniref:F-box domain-containing protein n=1 Tax=Kalanchoe fedtschenkoi TaxID=63787 RepID=A0A7N0V159_KALFE
MSKQTTRTIEDLPEDVLSIIMSKFSIKEGLRASLTCKQWLGLPTCLSEITFDTLTMAGDDTQLGEADRDLFIERVNRFLEQYGQPPLSGRMPLSAFRIAFWLDRDSAAVISSWVRFALSNGVRVLEVVLKPDYTENGRHDCVVPDEEIYAFPCDLLNRPQIAPETLWLVSCAFGRNLNTKLTSLKQLDLWSTTLTEADTRNILTYCTSLSRLTLPEKLIVGGSCLAYFRVQWCKGVSEIELSDGSALKCFVYQGEFIIKFTKFCEAPKLTEIHFNMRDFEWVGFYISQVLHLDFPAMQNLTLYGTRPPLSLRPGAFRRLEVLKLFYGNWPFSLLAVLKLLQACPVLRCFEMVPSFRCEGGKDVNVRLPIEAFHNSLQMVEIRDFSCSKEQVELVSMIIQASAVIEQVTIICVRKDHKKFQGIQKMKLAKSIFLKLMQGRTLIFN